ncbi:hypothetical protein [Alteribacter aurantiacus]|uniref:hypothetical protein n=1 Tax=Alteribacter aurantiacus TaxID=254410 RepID=UPI00040622CC|nr:hypothetical protein [Alteribacter aurantiacus]
MRSAFFARLLAIGQALFTVGYFSYMFYIAFSWGFTPRIIQILVTDSIYLFFLISSVGLFLFKSWGWWVTVILYGKLLLSKVIGAGSEWFLLLTGTIAERWQWGMFFADFFIMLLYVLVLVVLFTKQREKFKIEDRGVRLAVLVCVGVVLLYSLYFIAALWLIIQLGV